MCWQPRQRIPKHLVGLTGSDFEVIQLKVHLIYVINLQLLQ